MFGRRLVLGFLLALSTLASAATADRFVLLEFFDNTD